MSPAELLSGLGHFIFFHFFGITVAEMIEDNAVVSVQIWRGGFQEEKGDVYPSASGKENEVGSTGLRGVLVRIKQNSLGGKEP